MSDSDLRRQPHVVAERQIIREHKKAVPPATAWWCEEPQGIVVVLENWSIGGSRNETEQVKIPWGALRRALARKDKE